MLEEGKTPEDIHYSKPPTDFNDLQTGGPSGADSVKHETTYFSLRVVLGVRTTRVDYPYRRKRRTFVSKVFEDRVGLVRSNV